jgi:hypothetical protein
VRGPIRWVVKGAAFAVMALAVFAAIGFVVMSLWNWLVPALFRGPALEYWQAVGLLVLSRLLFGSLRGRGGWHGHWRQRMWRERWDSMTPEERQRLRERFMHRWNHCGHGPDPGETPREPNT